MISLTVDLLFRDHPNSTYGQRVEGVDTLVGGNNTHCKSRNMVRKPLNLEKRAGIVLTDEVRNVSMADCNDQYCLGSVSSSERAAIFILSSVQM